MADGGQNGARAGMLVKQVADDVEESWESYRERLSHARELADGGLDDEALAVYDEVSETLAGSDDPNVRYSRRSLFELKRSD